MLFKCELADLKIELEYIYPRTQKKLLPYSAEFEKTDIAIKITQEDIEFERDYVENEELRQLDRFLELTAVFRHLAEQLVNFDGAVLHSCAFLANDKGIAFGAHSGTGKTTHMMLWQNMLGDKFKIINGDKPFVRFIDDKLYVYGSIWAGKERLYNDIKAPLTDICKIVRSETNVTEKMPKEEGIKFLMQQLYMPADPVKRIKTIELIYRIAEKVNFWQINCNMEPEAAEVAYNAIFGKNQ